MKVSFATRINLTKLMVSGLTSKTAQMSKYGVDEELISSLSAMCNELETLNNEQERLKADLKTKTALINDKVKKIDEDYTRVKKLVKIGMPQTQWLEFGINDKK